MKLGLADFEGYQPFQVAKKPKINKWLLSKLKTRQLLGNHGLEMKAKVYNCKIIFFFFLDLAYKKCTVND